jgi:hypothetical protein
MPTRPSNKKLDFSQIAVQVVEAATKSSLKPTTPSAPTKNPAAVALGRLGASKGGKARAKKLSAKKRAQIAKKAATARWRKPKT